MSRCCSFESHWVQFFFLLPLYAHWGKRALLVRPALKSAPIFSSIPPFFLRLRWLVFLASPLKYSATNYMYCQRDA